MNLFENLLIISLMTIIVKIFGFIKDIIFANLFGASSLTDCFFNSFKLINLFRKILAEGIFSQLCIPILVEYKKKNNNIKIFIRKIIGFLIIFTSITIAFCFVFSRKLITLMNPGCDIYKINKTKELFILLLPYILISSLISLTNSIFNTYDIFLIPSITPIILNIVTILFLYCKLINKNIIILPLSILIGGIIQLLIHYIYINNKLDIKLLPLININDNDIKKFYKSTVPVIFNTLVNQSSLILNSILSSFLDTGSISWIYYSDKIMEFPSGILGVSLSTMILPILSKNNNNLIKYSSILDWSIKISLILSIPLFILILMLSKYIIITLFYYGNFNYYDVEMTKKSLISYSFGLIFIILSKIFISAFNAKNINNIPLKLSIISIFITQILNIFLLKLFKHVGLSLSISFNYILYCILLFIYLIKNKIYISNNNWKNLFKKIFISSISMILILLFLINKIQISIFDNYVIRILKLLSFIILGILFYFISLFFMGIKKKDFIFS